MPRTIPRLLIVAIVAMAAASLLPAYAQNFKVTGTVTLEDGTPVKGAKFIADPITEGRRQQVAKTKKDGGYLLPFMEFGDYRYRVEAEGLLMRSMAVKVTGPDKQVALEQTFDIGPDQSGPNFETRPAFTVEINVTMVTKDFFAGMLVIAGDAAANALLNESTALFQEGKFAEADAKLDEILAGSPDTASALYMKGLVDMRLGKPLEAEPHLRRAHEIDPTLPGVAAQIGNALFESGKKQESIEWFEKELSNSPDAVPVAINIAVVKTEIGDREGAIAAWERVLALNPGEANAYIELASLYTDAGDEERASQYLMRMEEVAKPSAAAWYNIGANYSNSDQLDKAELAFRKAIEIDPALSQAQRELGYLMMKKGDMAAALANFKKYVEVAPNAPDAAEMKDTIQLLEQSINKK